MSKSNLLALQDHGQSYWLDNLTREMIESGELRSRVEKNGLRGITSNPKTFATSVQNSDRYDNDVKQLVSEKLAIEDIYEHLMVDDVARACDILMPVYESTEGKDGFVSIEVDPRLARHTKATFEAARNLWGKVARPNCMIKIPGTEEGLPAIELALAHGINVNITLLFSLGRYKQVVAAYQMAMDKRRTAGQPLDGIASVASFFLSRIDVLVDELLTHRSNPLQETDLAREMRGNAAINSARLVYDEFNQSFSGAKWDSLQSAGAQLQRPLWASTSTKNPAYPETLYVDTLIADNTVTTMPEKTIEAFEKNGTLMENSIMQREEQPIEVMESLHGLGIDFDYVEQRLEDEGIQKFISPFEEGIKSVRKLAENMS